jgi:catechol 2,3-dioxygenase-like lactoylglutathione lyase family enzyme
MRLTGSLLVALALVAAVPHIHAQTPILPVLDHIHLLVPDQAKGVDWYQKAFGGEKMTEAPDRLMMGQTRLIFLRNEKGQPSEGSAIDHIGFTALDVDAKVKELEAAGAKVLTAARDVPGLFRLAFVQDPWGTKLEIAQLSNTPGLDHVHLRAPDPAQVLAWYKDKFGGESAKLKDRIDGLKYGNMWLLVQRGDAVPSDGRAVDHIGFRTTDLAAKTTEFKAQGVKYTTEPRPLKLPSGVVVTYAYLEGPAGAKIELVQR